MEVTNGSGCKVQPDAVSRVCETCEANWSWSPCTRFGIVALFLPFSTSTSPWEALSPDLGYGYFAMPAFLAGFVWLLTLRSLLPMRLTRPELWLCTALSVLGIMIPVSFWSWNIFAGQNSSAMPVGMWIYLIMLALLSTAGLGFLMLVRRLRLHPDYAAPSALRCGYLPNAIHCLYLFSGLTQEPDDLWRYRLEIGAVLVAVTVVLYPVEMGHFTRQGLRARQPKRPTPMSAI